MAGHLKAPKSLEKPKETPGWVSGKVLAELLGMSRSAFQAKLRPLALPAETEKRGGQVFYHARPLLERYFRESIGCAFPHCLGPISGPHSES
jgi:hypothetical protein